MTQCSFDYERANRARKADDAAQKLTRAADNIESTVWGFFQSLKLGATFTNVDVREYVLARRKCDSESPSRIFRYLRNRGAVRVKKKDDRVFVFWGLDASRRSQRLKTTKLDRLKKRRAALKERLAQVDAAIAEEEKRG